MTIEKIIKSASKYHSDRFSLDQIKKIKNSFEKPHNYSIVLGSSGWFWIVTNREASILAKNGFELA